jgi:hypothetical protein
MLSFTFLAPFGSLGTFLSSAEAEADAKPVPIPAATPTITILAVFTKSRRVMNDDSFFLLSMLISFHAFYF